MIENLSTSSFKSNQAVIIRTFVNLVILKLLKPTTASLPIREKL